MGKTLDFTNLIGRYLSNVIDEEGSGMTYYFGKDLKTIRVYNLKKNSYKEIVLNVIPLKNILNTPIAESRGVPINPNPYTGFTFRYYKGTIITNKYVYPFYRTGTVEVEKIKIGHLTYKIEGNLWVKQ